MDNLMGIIIFGVCVGLFGDNLRRFGMPITALLILYIIAIFGMIYVILCLVTDNFLVFHNIYLQTQLEVTKLVQYVGGLI